MQGMLRRNEIGAFTGAFFDLDIEVYMVKVSFQQKPYRRAFMESFGGSNFAGIAFPFLGEKLRGGQDVDIIAVEPANCPTLSGLPPVATVG